jgi:hypothetical protein
MVIIQTASPMPLKPLHKHLGCEVVQASELGAFMTMAKGVKMHLEKTGELP